MLRCESCKIDIRGDKTCCPLCHGALTGTPEMGGYPAVARAKISRVSAARIVSMLYFGFALIMGTIASHMEFRHPWMILVIVAVGVLWLDVILNLYYQHNAIRILTVQFYLGIGVTLFVDWATGYRGWSVTWVIPFAFIALAIITLIVARGLRLHLTEYLVYLITDAVVSLIQVVFLVLHMEIVRLPLIISVAIMTGGALAVLFFRRRALRTSMHQSFHI